MISNYNSISGRGAQKGSNDQGTGMTEQQVRQISQEEMIKNYRSGTPYIPPHTHDGNDNLQINAKNIIPNSKYVGFLQVTAGTSAENLLIINRSTNGGVSNPASIYFYGISRNNVGADGIPTGDPTKKSCITGKAELGKVFQLLGQSSGTVPNTIGTIANTIQTNNSSFFDNTSGAWIPHVNVDSINLAAIYDSDSTLLGNLQVTSFTDKSITLQCPLSAGWYLKGSLLII